MLSFKLKAAAGIVVAAVMLFGVPVHADNAASYIDEEYIQYCVEIGEEYGLCPYILVALIERESSGHPDAKNGSCKGLCQVSEKWHKDRMQRLGVTDIYDPYGNILLAADFIMEMAEDEEEIAVVLGRFHGESHPETKISSYTSGILARSAEMERYYYGPDY